MKNMLALADSTDRPAWLEARKPVITASQVSSLVGTNPYTSLIDVWNEKHDPTWVEDRNWRLDERAAYGRAQEASLVEFAAAELGLSLTANTILYCDPQHPLDACTPDAYGYRTRSAKSLVVVDAKTTETDWQVKGVPQYIIDQMLWTWHVTGCAEIYLAVERTKWTKGNVEVLGRWVYQVPLDDGARVRLDFLIEQVALFRTMVADGIAPESDVDIRHIDFDTDPDDAALFREAESLLDDIAEIEDRIADDVKALAAKKARVKELAVQYQGRRVWLIGTRRVAKLVRFWQAKPDYSAVLSDRQVAAATRWVEADRMVIEANPEHQPDVAA